MVEVVKQGLGEGADRGDGVSSGGERKVDIRDRGGQGPVFFNHAVDFVSFVCGGQVSSQDGPQVVVLGAVVVFESGTKLVPIELESHCLAAGIACDGAEPIDVAP